MVLNAAVGTVALLVRVVRNRSNSAVEEEENVLSLMIWPANRKAKLVPDIRILAAIGLAIEPVAGAAKTVPAARIVSIAMELVGAALGHYVDDGAGVAAVLSSEVVGDDAKFLVESGVALSTPPKPPGTEVSLLSTPSSRKLLLRSREPFTETPPSPLLVTAVPGDSRTNS